MLNQIKRNAQTKPILSMLGMQYALRPDIKTLYVTANGFRALVAALPQNMQKLCDGKIDCDDFVIKIKG